MDRQVRSVRPPVLHELAFAGAASPRCRRMFDKLLTAFHHACDIRDIEMMESLLTLLEKLATRSGQPGDGNRRRTLESLVAAHERVWHLRHPYMD